MSVSAPTVAGPAKTVWPPVGGGFGGDPRRTTLEQPPSGVPTWLKVVGIGLATIGGVAIAAKLGPALLASRSTGATLAKFGIGTAAVVGGAALLASCAGRKGKEYIVHFATEPDLTGVPENQVYNVLRAHHERFAPAVEAELAALKTEGKVSSYSGIVGSNGFVINVARGKDAEVKARLAAIPVVGTVESADLE